MFGSQSQRRWFLTSACTLALLAAVVGGGSAGAQDADELIERLGLRLAPEPVAERPDWRQPSRIVLPRVAPNQLAALQAVAPDAQLITVRSSREALEHVDSADVLIGYCDNALVSRGKNIRWIQLGSAGAEYCVAALAAAERAPLLTNMQRVLGPQIAEHALAMMFSLTRGLHRYGELQRQRQWRRAVPNEDMWEIDGKTMLVVGLGGIGSEIAWRADALGMSVLATRASSREGPPYVEYVGLADELLALAARADVIVNATPLTPKTRGLFNAEFFRQMKPQAYFINVGRGGSVATDDLVAALEAGELAGAGLDVTDPEPLPADHPLWQMSNVVVTPHVAGASDLRGERMFTLIRENLRRYVAGEPMLSVVDTARGY